MQTFQEVEGGPQVEEGDPCQEVEGEEEVRHPVGEVVEEVVADLHQAGEVAVEEVGVRHLVEEVAAVVVVEVGVALLQVVLVELVVLVVLVEDHQSPELMLC